MDEFILHPLGSKEKLKNAVFLTAMPCGCSSVLCS